MARQDYSDYRRQFLYPSNSLMIKTGLWLELEATIATLEKAVASASNEASAIAAFDKAFGLLFVVGLGLAGFGIVAGLIYAAVVWSLLAVIPLGLYLTAWLLTIRN